MKKNYENPIIEIIKVDVQDVITTSGDFGQGFAGEIKVPWE